MPTLQNRGETLPFAAGEAAARVESGLRRIAPSLLRNVAETAGAFFATYAALQPVWEGPRIPEAAAVNCSQMNLGPVYEMLCCLTTDKDGFDRMFPEGMPELLKMDAYCELANCICGSLLSDPGFTEAFGHLVPCVPCLRPGRIQSGSKALRGSFLLNGSRVHFSLSLRPT